MEFSGTLYKGSDIWLLFRQRRSSLVPEGSDRCRWSRVPGRIQFLPRDLLTPRPLVISDMLCKGRHPKWSSVDRGAKLVDGGGVLTSHIEGLAVPLCNRTCSLTQNRICGCPPVAAEEGTSPGAFGVKSLQLSLQRVNPEAVGAGPSACTPVMSQGLEHSGPLALCNSPLPPPRLRPCPMGCGTSMPGKSHVAAGHGYNLNVINVTVNSMALCSLEDLVSMQLHDCWLRHACVWDDLVVI